MNRLILFFRKTCVAFALLLFFSCGETVPIIIFTTPQDKQNYFKDEDIEIKIILTDTKGKAFTVQLYIDGDLLGEVEKAPYYFTLKAGTVPPGEHIIKAKVNEIEDYRTITIDIAASESDSFVTFANGEIPYEWSANGWQISTTDGFDDKFSLMAFSGNATVTTHKKCSKIEFYMNGLGIVDLFLDETSKLPWQTIYLGIIDTLGDPAAQEWECYQFLCPYVYHTFTWKTAPGHNLVGLDAIRFSN